MTTFLRNVVVDCLDPVSLSAFWAEALGWGVELADPTTRAALEGDRGAGAADERVTLVGPDGAPRLYFQRVPDPTPGKNRLHLDLEVTDAEADVSRLIALGARDPIPMTESLRDVQERWFVLHDPEGNAFCVQEAGSPQLP